MIVLITGVPGAGKTCYMMDFLLAAKKEGRPLFVHGIPELTIEHTPIYCTAQGCKVCHDNKDLVPDDQKLYAEKWDKWAPDGAFITMDEVQNVYRPRRQGVEIPSSVKAFETHRHSGIDFYMLSQSPMLFDSNIRRLVTKHIHLKGNWAGRTQFEWGECKDDPKKISDGVKSRYSLTKSNFKLYKSAEMHTKIPRRIPNAVYLTIGALFLVGFLGTKVYARISSFIDPDEAFIPEPDGAPLAGAPTGSVSAPSNNEFGFITGNAFERVPVISGFPESAPAFADLVEIQVFPRLASCVYTQSKNSCNCYTQQATRLDMPFSQCYNFAHNPTFNPYKVESRARSAEVQRNQPRSSPASAGRL